MVFCSAFLALSCIILMFQNHELKRSNLENTKKEGGESLITNNDFNSFVYSRQENNEAEDKEN